MARELLQQFPRDTSGVVGRRVPVYTLWELFDRGATLYGEQSRYETLASVHDDLLGTIETGLPPEAERPTVAYLSIATDLSAMYLLRLNAPGYFNSHTRPLGAIDAFSGEEWEGAFKQVDMEALLEADPDAILALWTVTDAVDFEKMTQNLRDDPVGGELSAVQNDRVYVQPLPAGDDRQAVVPSWR